MLVVCARLVVLVMRAMQQAMRARTAGISDDRERRNGHPSHIGQQTKMNLNPMPGVACGINLKYDFIAKVLKRAGYRTAALGKWYAFDQPAGPRWRGPPCGRW